MTVIRALETQHDTQNNTQNTSAESVEHRVYMNSKGSVNMWSVVAKYVHWLDAH